MQKQKGFTIIELIVVIAIIAVLASIVLVNVTSYINKSKNAAIQGNLATLLTNGAIYFDNNNAALGSAFTADTTGCSITGATYLAIKSAYNNTANLACKGSGATQAWCAYSSTLVAGSTAASTWCVDSSGYKGTTTTNCTSSNFCCSATCL